MQAPTSNTSHTSSTSSIFMTKDVQEKVKRAIQKRDTHKFVCVAHNFAEEKTADPDTKDAQQDNAQRISMDDYVFVLFLDERTPANTCVQRTDLGDNSQLNISNVFVNVLNWGIRTLQPTPALSHAEIVCIPDDDEVSSFVFSTYIGDSAGWRNVDNFYFNANAGKWRALPIQANKVQQNVRELCNIAEGSCKYSLFRYISSLSGFQWVSQFLSDKINSPSHCSGLVARLLRLSTASPAIITSHSATFGPASLYLKLRLHICNMNMMDNVADKATVEQQVASHIVLNEPDHVLMDHSDKTFHDAILHLSQHAVDAIKGSAYSEAPDEILAQKALARAILRYGKAKFVAHRQLAQTVATSMHTMQQEEA